MMADWRVYQTWELLDQLRKVPVPWVPGVIAELEVRIRRLEDERDEATARADRLAREADPI